jgi:phospholipid-transporting ATPase
MKKTEKKKGVGIQGEEGSQAARSSDFAIGQFKYLQRLLFVHGTWSFHRQTQLIFYQFYIQIIFNFITFYFQSLDQFSLQTIYQPLLQTLYYTVFTGLPILFSAILFKHLSESLIFDYPQAYKNNVINSPFSIVQFWSKLVIGICHTLVIFLIVENVYKEMNFSLWLFGSTMYTCVMLTVTYILFLQTPRFTIIEILALLLSLIFYLSLQYFVSTINSQLFYNYLGMFHIVGKSFASWLIYLLVPTTVLLLHLGLL